MRFAARWRHRRWAVEGCHGAGRSLAQRLVVDGERVVDCPPSWRLECGCSPKATARRPTATTPCRSASRPWTPTDSTTSSSTTPRSPSGGSQTAAKSSSRCAPKRSVNSTASRAGNRRINHALHMAAVTQLRNPTSAGRDYYERKLAAGKTRKEALRCLKRRLSDVVFRQLVIDLQPAATAPNTITP